MFQLNIHSNANETHYQLKCELSGNLGFIPLSLVHSTSNISLQYDDIPSSKSFFIPFASNIP